MAIYTDVLTGGSNNHETTSEAANAVATDFVSEGVVGAITNTSGVAPATGSFAVNAQGTPDMTVAVSAGQAYVTATPSSQNSQTLRVRNTATANVTISANSSGSTKYDWIYLSVSAANAANPNAAGDNVTTLVASRSSSSSADDGTPPTYGYLLAVVTVANGASSITNGNIADRRATSGVTPAQDTVTDDLLDYPRWYQEIGRTTLSGSADSISVTSLPVRKYLKVLIYTTHTGGTGDHFLRFNNDSGSNYARRVSDNGGADNTAGTSQTGLALDPGANAAPIFTEMEIINVAAQEKLVNSHCTVQNTAGAATVSGRRELVGKWANTSDSITRIDVVNIGGTGDFASGSQVVVLGHD